MCGITKRSDLSRASSRPGPSSSRRRRPLRPSGLDVERRQVPAVGGRFGREDGPRRRVAPDQVTRVVLDRQADVRPSSTNRGRDRVAAAPGSRRRIRRPMCGTADRRIELGPVARHRIDARALRSLADGRPAVVPPASKTRATTASGCGQTGGMTNGRGTARSRTRGASDDRRRLATSAVRAEGDRGHAPVLRSPSYPGRLERREFEDLDPARRLVPSCQPTCRRGSRSRRRAVFAAVEHRGRPLRLR